VKTILTIMTILVLSVGVSGAFEDQTVRRQYTGRLDAKAAEDARAQNEKLLIGYGGPGWLATAAAWLKMGDTVNDNPRIAYVIANWQRNRWGVDGEIMQQFVKKSYPGSSFKASNGSGIITIGLETWTLQSGKTLRYELSSDEQGLSHAVTSGEPGTYTVSAGPGVSITAKIYDMAKNSRIVDANLPINARQTLLQIYNKRGVSWSEKALVQMLEGFYRDALQPKGVSLQDMMIGLLGNIDMRTAFLDYCEKVPVEDAITKTKTFNKD